jgi:hypothetical protein
VAAKGKMIEPIELPEVPEVPPTILPDTTEPVVFDSRQQALFDRKLKESHGRIAKEARAEAERLRVENEHLREVASGNGADSSELQKIRGELAASKIERDAIAASAAQSKKESFIAGQVQKQGFVCDATTLTQLTANDLTYDETAKTFVTADGSSADDYFTNFAASRPYLVKGSVISGTGQGGSSSTQPPANQYDPAKLWGPNAVPDAGRILNAWAIRDKHSYSRARAVAKSKGWVI